MSTQSREIQPFVFVKCETAVNYLMKAEIFIHKGILLLSSNQ